MKKRIFCLLFALSLLLSACTETVPNGPDETGTGTTAEENTAAPQAQSLVLAENGKAEYVIVCDREKEDEYAVASRLRYLLKELTGLRFDIADHKDPVAEREILIGKGISRNETSEVYKSFTQRKESAVTVKGQKLVLAGYDRMYNTLALLQLMEAMTWDPATKTLSVSGSLSYLASDHEDEIEQTVATEEYIALYQATFDTYSTYREQRFDKLSNENKEDQYLIEALIERMGDAAAFYVGSSSLLHTGYIRKLDTEDYFREAKLIENDLWIPRQYAEFYFEKALSADSDGYVNVSAYCRENSGFSLYQNDKLFVLTPSSVESFAEQNQKVNGYTNAAYVTRMKTFFTTTETPEPKNNTEQTRVELVYLPFSEDVADWTEVPYDTAYSPAICEVEENGVKTIYAVYEIATVIGAFETYGTNGNLKTYVKKSTDGGKTWQDVCVIPGLHYASPISVNGEMLLIGLTEQNSMQIAKLSKTQIGKYEIVVIKSEVRGRGGAPGTMVIKDGILYRGYNSHIYSASLESDLMQSASWTVSDNVYDTMFSGNWWQDVSGSAKPSNAQGEMEPSLVIGPDGDVYFMARIDGMGTNRAVVLKLKSDRKTFEYVGNNKGLITFPNSYNRFSVQYDEVTGKYISLTCVETVKGQHDRARRTLAIVTSTDLIHWEIADYVLTDREMVNPTYATWFHAFQYVDFVISGDDLLLLVRESTGDANCYHDGTYITFYRMEDFRTFIA